MFTNILNEYKKNSHERKINIFYWSIALILIILSTIIKTFTNLNTIIICISLFATLIIAITIYFIKDYKRITKNQLQEKKLKDKLIIYVEEINKQKINKLIDSLKMYNISNKTNLKLAIDFYNNEKPKKIESDYLGWIVSSALTISSFIEIAYDSQSQTIDTTKLSVIMESTIGYIIIIILGIGMIKSIISGIIIPKQKSQSEISEDLTYIYINYNKYKNKLEKQKKLPY